MKKLISLILTVIMCASIVGCGQTEDESKNIQQNYAETVPNDLQGVWEDNSIEGIVNFYAFKDNNFENYILYPGADASKGFYGVYTVENDKVIYTYDEDFLGGTDSSDFLYDNGTLVLTNTNNIEIKKLSAEDILEYLIQEESKANFSGVIHFADIISKYYPDSAENSAAEKKKESVTSAIEVAGKAALQKLNTEYDKVEKLTWYDHKNKPQYTDICCYIYPYIGQMDDGFTWLRVKLNYTDAQTNAGWIFFDNVIFSVDGENTTKYFDSSDITRDNDTEVWEIADFAPEASEVQLLKNIANSNETIIRFQGAEHYVDHIVTDKEKAAINDVLTAFNYLNFHAE